MDRSFAICYRFDHHGTDPVHMMYDEVVSKHLPKAVMLGPDSWLTGSGGRKFIVQLSLLKHTTLQRPDSRPTRCTTL
jgi:hypothetical protein